MKVLPRVSKFDRDYYVQSHILMIEISTLWEFTKIFTTLMYSYDYVMICIHKRAFPVNNVIMHMI